MAAALRKLKILGSMLLPYGIHEISRRFARRAHVSPDIAAAIAPNAVLRERHAGERCFILGNGPSVKKLDLSLLAGETVISVSNGYLHKNFASFAPRYHCVPQITYGKMTESDVVAWFKEMDEGIGDAEVFLSTNELRLVKSHGLFPRRTIRYLHLRESFDELAANNTIEITRSVPGVESVPVMALMIALYMGFKEIILLGVDHDHFLTSRYDYAFELRVQAGKDVTIERGGTVATTRYEDFHALARLWRQYRKLALIASARAARIYNSTPGGELDEFERVAFERWFQ